MDINMNKGNHFDNNINVQSNIWRKKEVWKRSLQTKQLIRDGKIEEEDWRDGHHLGKPCRQRKRQDQTMGKIQRIKINMCQIFLRRRQSKATKI